MFDRDSGSMRLPRRRERGGRLVALLAVVGGVVVVLLFLQSNLIDLPDWFAGGESDPAPRGTVEYKGQQAKSASENFLVDIGDGEATVSVKAKQNWDTPGNVISGDFQSTNGTSSVADPDDRDVPASLKVRVDYCADGLITSFEPVDPGEGEPTRAIRFEMGDLFVCNATLEHSVQNDAAFKQDDTPNIFHGEFTSFVARAAEWTAAAAECPTEELEEFQSDAFVGHVTSTLAEQYGIAEADVEVVPGTPGTTSDRMQARLRERLESYANAEDPDDPDETYEALDIQYLSADGEAVADSCYREPGSRSLDQLDQVNAPDPDEPAR
ncbi:MAG TPA: hypothetical protein VK611_19315 [Acidimicrobiales bacterium]|nr:hypothetical protein [Acidimicrobiales bacterium]